MKAVVKSIRISPKKLNLLAELIRNKNANEAMEILKLLPKKGAKILHKTIKSAMANATNNFKQEAESLMIKEVLVGKAPTFKRWIPASRGRAQPILKRNSYLSITIGVKEPEEDPVEHPSKAEAMAAEKESQKKPVKKAKASTAPAKPAAKAAPKSTKTTKA